MYYKRYVKGIFTVTENKNRIFYYKNGDLHRDDDRPAIIIADKDGIYEEFRKDGNYIRSK